MQFRHIGIETEIEGVAKLTEFGQSVELPDALATAIVSRNAPLITERQWELIGFTAEEAEKYKYAGARGNNEDPDFMQKHRSARMFLHDLRTALRAGISLKEATGGNS